MTKNGGKGRGKDGGKGGGRGMQNILQNLALLQGGGPRCAAIPLPVAQFGLELAKSEPDHCQNGLLRCRGALMSIRWEHVPCGQPACQHMVRQRQAAEQPASLRE